MAQSRSRSGGRTTAKGTKPRGSQMSIDDVEDNGEEEPGKIRRPLDHLRSRKKQVYADIAIPDDASYLVARDEAKSRLAQFEAKVRITREGAKLDADTKAELESLKEEIREAEAALKEHLIWFRGTSLPPKQYEKLVAQFPPTKDQVQEAKKIGVNGLSFDTEKFLPELITRCVTYAYVESDDGEVGSAYPDDSGRFGDDVMFEPLTHAFLDEMQNEGNWAAGEIQILAETAHSVNQNVRRVGTLGNV